MDRVRNLLRKVKKAFAEGGVKGVAVRTKDYLVFQAARMQHKDKMKDILFVNGCTLPHPERYRVDHQIEQLEYNGMTVDKIFYLDVNPEKLKFYRAVVLFRCPYTDAVGELIEKAHYFNKKVFFDIDDLVIDKNYTDHIKYVAEMSPSEKALYDDGVERMGKTMQLCDYCITTTEALARELRKYNKEVYVNRNVASEEMIKLSLAAAKNTKKADSKIRIGYLSGSITHNPDFELVQPALVKIMDEYPQVELTVMGYLDLPEAMQRFEGRIVRRPFADWRKLPEVIAELDINLAPVEETIFNEAKSENKWMEAALCKVVTVASDFGAFKQVIQDSKTGILCKTGEDWYEKLKLLIEKPELRKEIAANAHQKVMKDYVTTYSGLGLARFIEGRLAKNIGFVLPSTNISGGVNVVLKHCDILRRHGYDVTVLNMDKSDEDFVSQDGVVSVVSTVKHEITAKFEMLVATLFTTLKFVKSYPEVQRKMYLVQNFETDFNEYGDAMRKEANATYNKADIEYITISKWCEEWLQKDFQQKVKYAPNGINLSNFEYKEREFNKKIRILVEGNSDDYYKNVDESFKIAEKLDPDKYEVLYLSYQGKPKEWYRVDKFYHRVPHDKVGRVYAEADILLKSSILESFSYPPLEMMATGGYAVVLPNAGNQEYLRDEENCLFYKQGDLDDAAQQIERIVADGTLRKKLAKGMQKTIAERDWKDVENKVLDLYR